MRGLIQDLRYAARFLVRAPETARAVAQAMDDRIIIDRIQPMDQVRGSLVADERFATLMPGCSL